MHAYIYLFIWMCISILGRAEERRKRDVEYRKEIYVCCFLLGPNEVPSTYTNNSLSAQRFHVGVIRGVHIWGACRGVWLHVVTTSLSCHQSYWITPYTSLPFKELCQLSSGLRHFRPPFTHLHNSPQEIIDFFCCSCYFLAIFATVSVYSLLHQTFLRNEITGV